MEIEIREESTDEQKRFVLYTDRCRRGMVSMGRDQRVQYHWDVAGPIYHAEAKIMLRGLLELSMIADQLEAGVHGQIKAKKRRR